MLAWRILKPLRPILAILTGYLALVAVMYFRQRSMLFFPTHNARPTTSLWPWQDEGHVIGYCHEVANPDTIWLMLHGNGGQAADRDHALHCLPGQDSLYVLEYPGYGLREGHPSRETLNQAAVEAYHRLRTQHPKAAVCVIGESLGSGPACALAAANPPPDKIVLLAPFDVLARVASRRFPFLPVRLLLRDAWDNVQALKDYRGPVEIFAALNDQVIPVEHARALAEQVPGARLTIFPGGHTDWSDSEQVKIRR